MVITCAWCKKEIRHIPPSRKAKLNYCSRECCYNDRRIKCKCGCCGVSFLVPKHFINKGRGKFCSRTCTLATVFTGRNNPNWNGGKRKAGGGYVAILKKEHPYAMKNGYVLEHRLVMEKELGRFLLPTETIHHIDGNKQNNSIENLRLYINNSEHKKEEEAMLKFIKTKFNSLKDLQEYFRDNN